MRKRLFLALLGVMLIVPGSAFGNDWTGNLNLFLGAKYLDSDDWQPADNHGEIGALFDIRHRRWPASLAIDVFGSKTDDSVDIVTTDNDANAVDVEVRTAELHVGFRKIFENFHYIRPFIGGGVALVNADLHTSQPGVLVPSSLSPTLPGTLTPDNDTGAGVWLDCGVYWTLGGNFNVGVDFRYSTAEVNINNVDANAGGGHAGFLIGYNW
jgi:hypothetical protein